MNYLNYILIIFAFLFVVLFIIILLRDRYYTKQFASLRMMIDELKNIIDYQTEFIKKNQNKSNIKEIENSLQMILKSIKDKNNIINEKFKSIEYEIKKIEDELSTYKDVSSVNTKEMENSEVYDEHTILHLYRSGYSAYDIARKTKLPIGEIELILKMNNINS